jgi:hypothetical protein
MIVRALRAGPREKPATEVPRTGDEFMNTTRFSRVAAPVLVAALGAGLGGACARSDGEPASGQRAANELTWTVEFVKGRHGGLCVNHGGGALCRVEITVRDDGTWSAVGTQPPAPAEGTTEEGAATRLAAIVESEWDALTARPFTGTCPMAYDGQEMFYIVRRLPTGEGAELADADVRQLRSCTHDFEYPSARRALDRLEAEWTVLDLPPDS